MKVADFTIEEVETLRALLDRCATNAARGAVAHAMSNGRVARNLHDVEVSARTVMAWADLFLVEARR